jgi:hypothetical protein
VVSDLVKHSLDLAEVKEVRWDKGGSQPAHDYTFFYRNRNANHHFMTYSLTSNEKVGL